MNENVWESHEDATHGRGLYSTGFSELVASVPSGDRRARVRTWTMLPVIAHISGAHNWPGQIQVADGGRGDNNNRCAH